CTKASSHHAPTVLVFTAEAIAGRGWLGAIAAPSRWRAPVSTAPLATLKTALWRLSCVDESQCPIPGRSPVGAILKFRGGVAGFGCAGPRYPAPFLCSSRTGCFRGHWDVEIA